MAAVSPTSEFYTQSCKIECSPLYVACRRNDTNEVFNLLKDLSIEDINRIEPNKSTALHVASYYGHDSIVRMLLNHGASTTIKNKYGLTAIEEARYESTKNIFLNKASRKDEERFNGSADSIEWLAVNERAEEIAVFYRAKLEEIYKEEQEEATFIQFLSEVKRRNDEGLPKVLGHIRNYFDTHNPVHLVKAYTEHSAFYKKLNEDLAKHVVANQQWQTEANLAIYAPGIIAASISCSPKLDNHKTKGVFYRGMSLTEKSAKQYKSGSVIMIKSFLSTSTKREVAEGFISESSFKEKSPDQIENIPAICTYHIRSSSSALDLKEISVFPDESEVLILPFTVFQIKSANTATRPMMFELVEADRLFHNERLRHRSIGQQCGLILHLGFPCLYRSCCMRCCGVVESPEDEV